MRSLIFGPAQRTVGAASPASLFGILELEWIVVVCGEDVEPRVYRCDFTDTFVVEITDVLLYGRLRLDFVKDSRAQSVAILFNTVTYELYQEAVQTLLNSMDGCCQSVDDEQERVCCAEDLVTQISKRDSKIFAGRPAGACIRSLAGGRGAPVDSLMA